MTHVCFAKVGTWTAKATVQSLLSQKTRVRIVHPLRIALRLQTRKFWRSALALSTWRSRGIAGFCRATTRVGLSLKCSKYTGTRLRRCAIQRRGGMNAGARLSNTISGCALSTKQITTWTSFTGLIPITKTTLINAFLSIFRILSSSNTPLNTALLLKNSKIKSLVKESRF